VTVEVSGVFGNQAKTSSVTFSLSFERASFPLREAPNAGKMASINQQIIKEKYGYE
jgi:hypothetical protein